MIAPLQKEPPASKRQALSLCLLIVSLGLFSAPWSQAGIAQTKHNLTGTDGGPVMNVCIFCHTPAGDPNAAAEPSWNANSGDDHTTFTTFDDLGRLDPDRDGVAGTVSVACLSCHDDAQAFGVTTLSFDHPFGVAYRGVILEGIDLDQLPSQSTDASGEITLVQGSVNAPARFATRTVAANGFRVPTYGIIGPTSSSTAVTSVMTSRCRLSSVPVAMTRTPKPRPSCVSRTRVPHSASAATTSDPRSSSHSSSRRRPVLVQRKMVCYYLI